MPIRPPQVRTITFLSSACYIYHDVSVQFRTSACVATLSNISGLIYSFSSSGQEFAYCFLQIPLTRWTPLHSANTSHCKGVLGTYTLELSPMLGTQQKKLPEITFRTVSFKLYFTFWRKRAVFSNFINYSSHDCVYG